MFQDVVAQSIHSDVQVQELVKSYIMGHAFPTFLGSRIFIPAESARTELPFKGPDQPI